MTRQELLAIAKPILFNTEMVRAILEERIEPQTASGNIEPPSIEPQLHTAGKPSQTHRKQVSPSHTTIITPSTVKLRGFLLCHM